MACNVPYSLFAASSASANSRFLSSSENIFCLPISSIFWSVQCFVSTIIFSALRTSLFFFSAWSWAIYAVFSSSRPVALWSSGSVLAFGISLTCRTRWMSLLVLLSVLFRFFSSAFHFSMYWARNCVSATFGSFSPTDGLCTWYLDGSMSSLVEESLFSCRGLRFFAVSLKNVWHVIVNMGLQIVKIPLPGINFSEIHLIHIDYWE